MILGVLLHCAIPGWQGIIMSMSGKHTYHLNTECWTIQKSMFLCITPTKRAIQWNVFFMLRREPLLYILVQLLSSPWWYSLDTSSVMNSHHHRHTHTQTWPMGVITNLQILFKWRTTPWITPLDPLFAKLFQWLHWRSWWLFSLVTVKNIGVLC